MKKNQWHSSFNEGNTLFNRQEWRMIARVLGLGQISGIMTSRHDIEHTDLSEDPDEIMAKLDRNQHTRILITEHGRDPLGVSLDLRSLIRQPLVFSERVTLLQTLEQFRNARTHFTFVVDEFGSVEGVVMLSDVINYRRQPAE